jgi:PAS domain S-box-containing protein
VLVEDNARLRREFERIEGRFDEAQRLGGLGAWELDLETQQVWWSREQYRLNGFDFGARLTQETFLALVHPEDRPAFEATFARVVSEGSGELTYRIVRADGSVRHMQGTARLVRDAAGRPRRMHGANLDVTARVEAAAALSLSLREKEEVVEALLAAKAKLRESQRHYRSLFEEAPEAMCRTLMDGTITEANPAFARMLGYDSPDDIRGLTTVAFYVDPDARERNWARYRNVAVIDGVEVVWRRRDGRIIVVEISARVLRDEQNVPWAFQSFVRDVTETRARAARERELLEANRAKTHFLAAMSHELRTPLNAVLGLSEALLDGVHGALAPPQKRSLETIHASGRLLLHLINDVLDIARVEAGQLFVEAAEVALLPVVQECVALVHEAALAKQQRLEIACDASVGSVRADPRRLRQVLLNLLTNAIKFSPAGATVTIGSGHAAAGCAELWVADTGPGIPVEDRERVFDPFVRLASAHTEAQPGAGLGLALVKRITELQGGSVRVEDGRGCGARFVVQLAEVAAGERAAAESSPAAPAAAPRAPTSSPSEVVLLVEDDEANVETFRPYLQRSGYEVRVVRDGLAAVPAALADDVALVLMDVRLPGIDGLEAIRRIRARGLRKPIVAMTAHAMADDERRCLGAGATRYLSKPVALGVLVSTVRQLLAGEPRA